MYFYDYTTNYNYKLGKYFCTSKLCYIKPVGLQHKTTTIKEEVVLGIRPSDEMKNLIHKYGAVGKRIC